MTRLSPVRAHWRKLPERPDVFERIHAELAAAYERDKRIDAAIALYLEPEIDRMLADREMA